MSKTKLAAFVGVLLIPFGSSRALSAADTQRPARPDLATPDVSPPAEEVHYHARLGVSLQNAHGRVRVVAVLPASPADKAGLQAGDEIRTVAGERVRTAHALHDELSEHPAGQPLKLGIVRNQKLEFLTGQFGIGRRTIRSQDNPAALRGYQEHPAQAPAAQVGTRAPAAQSPPRSYAAGYRGPAGPAGAPTGPNVGADEYGDIYGGEPNQGLDRARREADPDSDLRPRSRAAERQMDIAEREFDRSTNRLLEKSGVPDEFERPLTREPRGYRVLSPSDPPSPLIDNVDRGPEQYYGRPGAAFGPHGDYPIPGDKGGISRDRRQMTAPDAYEPDRAGAGYAGDRSTRLRDQFNTHADRRNGRPDPVTGENDPQIRTQGPYNPRIPTGRPWRPDSSGGGSAFPAPASNRGINPPTESSAD